MREKEARAERSPTPLAIPARRAAFPGSEGSDASNEAEVARLIEEQIIRQSMRERVSVAAVMEQMAADDGQDGVPNYSLLRSELPVASPLRDLLPPSD